MCRLLGLSRHPSSSTRRVTPTYPTPHHHHRTVWSVDVHPTHPYRSDRFTDLQLQQCRSIRYGNALHWYDLRSDDVIISTERHPIRLVVADTTARTDRHQLKRSRGLKGRSSSEALGSPVAFGLEHRLGLVSSYSAPSPASSSLLSRQIRSRRSGVYSEDSSTIVHLVRPCHLDHTSPPG